MIRRLALALALLLLLPRAGWAQDWLMNLTRQFYTIRVGPQVIIGPAKAFTSSAADSGTGTPMDTRYARNLHMHIKVWRDAGATFNPTGTDSSMVFFAFTSKSHLQDGTDTSATFAVQPKRHVAAATSAGDTLTFGYTTRVAGATTVGPMEFPVQLDLARTGAGGVDIYWSDVYSGPPPAYTSWVARRLKGQNCYMTMTVEGCP